MQPTLSVGTINSRGAGFSLQPGLQPRSSRESGVTLIELLIVMTLVALIAGLAFPAVASGLDTLRLRSASDSIVSFLNKSLDRAERRERAVEIWITPADNTLSAISADGGFEEHMDVPDPIHIVSVQPAPPYTDPKATRRFLLYPGGAPPRIAIEIANQQGRRRIVSVDPITGFPRSEPVQQ